MTDTAADTVTDPTAEPAATTAGQTHDFADVAATREAFADSLIARMTLNPFESVTTVTVQIVTLLIGDTEFDNPKTLAAFALGLLLFVITLGLNLIALRTVRKYREKY